MICLNVEYGETVQTAYIANEEASAPGIALIMTEGDAMDKAYLISE